MARELVGYVMIRSCEERVRLKTALIRKRDDVFQVKNFDSFIDPALR
jgi:hypothetical protein